MCVTSKKTVLKICKQECKWLEELVCSPVELVAVNWPDDCI